MNFIIKTSLLYLLTRVSYSLEISLLSFPPTNTSYCPGTVNFTCIGTNIPVVLEWRVNGTVAGYYRFNDQKFPLPITPIDNIHNWVVPYINVIAASSDGYVMNVTSELIGNVDVFRRTKIQCASQGLHSETYYVIIRESPPPSPSIGSCFLSVPPKKSVVTFQWSSNFSNQYAIDNYRVTATRGSSSSSLLNLDDQLVNSNKSYSSSVLKDDMRYSFIVSAINCGDQEGDSRLFNIYVAKRLSSVFNVTMLYWQETSSIQLTWNQTRLRESLLEHSVGPDEYDFRASIQLLISDSTGRILKNESFLQNYDGYCNTDSECSISHRVARPESRYYTVSVTTAADRYDQCSVPANSYLEILPAFSLEMINSTLIRINSTLYALCTSSIKNLSTCSIQYGKDPWYQNMSPPVIGPMNRIFPLPYKEMTSSIYYYQVSVLINSTLKIIVRSYYQSCAGKLNDVAMPTYTFDNMDADMKNRVVLKWYQVGITVLAFVLVIITLAVAVVVLLLLYLKEKEKSQKIPASCLNISSPREVKLNSAPSSSSSYTGAKHAYGYGRECEEEVVYDDLQNYRSDHFQRCTTKATATETVNNSVYNEPFIRHLFTPSVTVNS